MSSYANTGEMIADAAEIIRPPLRMTVTECAERHVYIKRPGGVSGYYRPDRTPYMIGPQDMLTSREFEAVVLVAPAQCGKTQPILNWVAHSVIADPADMIIIEATQSSAGDFSDRRLDRLNDYSPDLKARISDKNSDDNKFAKKYIAGNLVTLGWPAKSVLSGKPIPRQALTDVDRMPLDIGGEGSPFDMARQRGKTYGSRKMTLAESSPGRELDPSTRTWKASTPHEAPPAPGILSLYNRGDRRRFYWPCPGCGETFEPSFNLLVFDREATDLVEMAEAVVMACPHNGCEIRPDKKDELNERAVNVIPGHGWVVDGQRAIRRPRGRKYLLEGEPRRSNIASYWLKGPAAAFSDWPSLVLSYMQAMREFERTGNSEGLKTTINQDQGEPFRAIVPEGERLPEAFEDRAEDLGERVVPSGARFLIPTIDIGARKFIVQVHAVGPDLEKWIVDRYTIKKSERLDSDGDPLPLDPAGYLEDWKLLESQVMARGYPLADDPKMMMYPLVTGCDSGGQAGVTQNAYKFYKHLRRNGKHRRFMLVKGASGSNAPRVQISYPDSKRKDRKAGARGEIPVYLLNTNLLKDGIANDLDREEPGPGYIHFPSWLPHWFYAELCAEIRTGKGWERPSNTRNEAFDLLVYLIAALVAVKAEKIDWSAPPGYAREAGNNPFVRRHEDDDHDPEPPPAPASRGRRVRSRGIR